jgi:hypothetical protein
MISFNTNIFKALLFIVVASLYANAQPIFLNNNNQLGMKVNVLNSSLNSTTIEFIFDGYNQDKVTINGNQYILLSAPEMIWLMDKSFPQLPISRNSIIIPDHAAMSFRILSSDIEEIHTLPIMPSKGHFTRDIDPNTIPYTYDKIYEQDTWYPSEIVKLDEPYIVKDLRGMTIQFNPIQYNPKQELLKVYKRIVLEAYVDQNKSAVNPFLRMNPFRGVTQEYSGIYETLFLNYGIGAFDYVPIPEPGRLLIIYASQYSTQIQPLAQWKQQKGIPTLLAEYPTVTGTGASAIKTYIQNIYNQPEGLTYIILVGEAAEIPTLNGLSEGAASDPCFVKLAGTDAYPDAYISRISPTSPLNCEYIIKKILKYEKYPDSGPNAAWYHKGVGVASNENGGTPYYDWQRMNFLRDTLMSHGFVSVDQLYDPGATSSQVTTSLNNGRSIINYIGHGSGTSWSTTGFNVTTIHQLANGWKNPFIIDVACQNGKFTLNECMEEAWIRTGDTTNPRGAIAVYGASTNASWVPPCDMQSHGIWLLANRMRNTVGGVCFNGVMKAMDLWGGSSGEGLKLMEQYNIFGDCSMVMNFGLTPDTIPPTTISNLSVTNPSSSSLTLNWTAPMDSSFGGVSSYDIRYSTSPITNTNFNSCPQYLYSGQNDTTGQQKSYTILKLNFNNQYYFAVKSKDMWGNTSAISNVVNGTTLYAPNITVNPDSLFKQMQINQTKVDSIIISNTSINNSTLDYSIQLTNNTFPQNAVQVNFTPVISYEFDKGENKEFPLPIFGGFTRGQGGPDAYGYKWIDSDAPNGPQYTWNDISTTGVLTTQWTPTGTYSAKDEGYTGPYNFGFNFKYYGQIYSQVVISSNGHLMFTVPTANTMSNTQIPSTATPNGIICPFWDDLDGGTTGNVYYKQESNKFIIQYSNWKKYASTNELTFQIVLYSSGKIEYFYKTMTGTSNSATVGIENHLGTVGLQVAYNAAYVKNNHALRFSAEPDWLASTNNSGRIYKGNHAAVILTFKSTDIDSGFYSMDMKITSNDPQDTLVTVPIKMSVGGITPVELTALTATAKKNNVVINWSTATEQNNRGFEVQRSLITNNKFEIWETSGFINGNGTTTQAKHYSYIDQNVKPGKYSYRLKQIDFDGTIKYSNMIEIEVSIPLEFSLSQNYPNPFNPVTTIKFSLPEEKDVTLIVYNSLGEIVTALLNEKLNAGYHQVEFNGSSIPSGVYFYKLNAGSFSDIKKMILIK